MPVNSYSRVPPNGISQGILSRWVGDILGSATTKKQPSQVVTNNYAAPAQAPTKDIPGPSRQEEAQPGVTPPPVQVAPPPSEPRSISGEPTGAIDRAIQDKQNDPMYLVHRGITAANDPNVPLPYDDRMNILHDLLSVKHGLTGSNYKPYKSQIASGQGDGANTGILGTAANIITA